MNLREWAKATHIVYSNRAREEHLKYISVTDVEHILRFAIVTLISTLVAGNDLRIDRFGRLWPEIRLSQRKVSNLGGQPISYQVAKSRIVRFRASRRLIQELNTGRRNQNRVE